MNKPYVMMGGTFDPVHHGHLRTALEIQQWLSVSQVALVPAKVPVHRESPGCSAQHRLAMVKQAVADEPALTCNPIEIDADHDSYTVLTLETLRQQMCVKAPLIIILGMDAFLKLGTWYRAADILALAHVLVVARPGYTAQLPTSLQQLIDGHVTQTKADLMVKPYGYVYFHEQTPLAISATQIRNLVRQQVSPRYLLPESVRHYIEDKQLYRTTEE